MIHRHELRGGGMQVGRVCRTEGNRGGKCDNCNSIIYKLDLKIVIKNKKLTLLKDRIT